MTQCPVVVYLTPPWNWDTFLSGLIVGLVAMAAFTLVHVYIYRLGEDA